MNNRQVIQKLQKIAQDLDEIGSYREAEKVDKILIKIALLSDEGAKSVIEPHPSKKYVRRYLEIPPQNIFESLQNKIDDLIGKLKKSKTIDKEKLTNEFINSIFQQYQTKGYVNSAFVDFITMSAKFVEELHKIIIDNPEQQETWRKLFQDIRFTLDRNIYFEVKKLDKKTIEESKNKTKIYETIHSLLKLEDFLPTQLISTIKAYKEFLDGRSELEQHFQSIADIGEMQPNAEIIAEQELRNYSEDTENKIQKLLESSVSRINMNKRQIVASLNKIANELDNYGLYKEANTLTNVMKKLGASVYNTDQFWIIDGIVRPVTSHEAQTGSIIGQKYINDVYRVLGEYLHMTLQDIMSTDYFSDYFEESDATNIFKISNYELEGILADIFDTYSEKYEDEFSKDDYIKNTIPKINSLGKSFFYAMKEPIYYALDNLGWIRINGNDIEMGKRLDDYTKSTIRRAMDEIFGDNATRMSFNIDSSSGYKTLTYDELY